MSSGAIANGDGFIHLDGGAGGSTRRGQGSALATLFAGTNISASNSVLSVADSAAGTKGVVIVAAGDGIDVSYSSGTATVAAENASASNPGVVELATDAEAIAGSSTSRAVTPANLAARSQTATYPEANESGSFTFTLNPGLGTNVIAQVYEVSSGKLVVPEITLTSANSGTTTTVNSTTVTIDDPVFTLGGDTAPEADDNKDRGIEFRYHDGSAATLGFLGFDDSAGDCVF